MYQAKVYVDFDEMGVLGRVTSQFSEPFDVPEEEVHDDGTISFVIDTRGHRDTFVETFLAAHEVSNVEVVDEDLVLVRKTARGASVVIRENHGKLRGVDSVHGTKRVFEVLLLRREDLSPMIAGLRELGEVTLGSIVDLTRTGRVLSERQHAAVSAALDIGYFQWPRDGDAEDLADELGVTRATALEHLRKAEQKLLRRALDAETDRPSTRDRSFLLEPDAASYD